MTQEMMQEAAQFGQPLGEFRTGWRFWSYVVGAAGGILLGLLFVVLIFVTSGSGDSSDATSNIVLAVVCFAAGGASFWVIAKYPASTVRLYQGGFTVTRGGTTTGNIWNDVATITQQIIRYRYYGITYFTSYRYRLSLANGQQVNLSETIAKAGQMGDIMQRQIAQALTPRALESLRSGATLSFGRLSVNPMGLSNGSATLPWQEIDKVAAQNGSIVIFRKGQRFRWGSTAIGKTPNAYVLLSVIDVMRRNAPPQPQYPPQFQPPR
jgi:hypothetical protein